MPATTVTLTGRDVTLTIDSVDHSPNVESVEVVQTHDRQRYELISGAVDAVLDTTSMLNVTMHADWGETSSLCEALWEAATTSPTTGITAVVDVNGTAWTGTVLPDFPQDGPSGQGKDRQAVRFSLPSAPDGAFTKAPAV